MSNPTCGQTDLAASGLYASIYNSPEIRPTSSFIGLNEIPICRYMQNVERVFKSLVLSKKSSMLSDLHSASMSDCLVHSSYGSYL